MKVSKAGKAISRPFESLEIRAQDTELQTLGTSTTDPQLLIVGPRPEQLTRGNPLGTIPTEQVPWIALDSNREKPLSVSRHSTIKYFESAGLLGHFHSPFLLFNSRDARFRFYFTAPTGNTMFLLCAAFISLFTVSKMRNKCSCVHLKISQFYSNKFQNILCTSSHYG